MIGLKLRKLAQRLSIASGIPAAHWIHRKEFVARLLYKDYNAGRDPMASMPGIEAITQGDYFMEGESYWPQMDPYFLMSLERHHPECIFALNYRDPDKLVDSMWRWYDLAARLRYWGAPGLPIGAAEKKERVRDWIENHYDFCRRFFRERRFIEYDIEDPAAPDIIGKVLNVELA